MKLFLLMGILPLVFFLQNCNPSQVVKSENQVVESIKEEASTLKYLVRESNNKEKKAPVLLLLHGYGSNENDLFSLSSIIPENWLVISARAPISISENQFKWYNVKLVGEEITMNFEDEEKSRQSLLELIDEVSSKYKVDKNKIVTAGFSQGANMALGLALTEPKKVLAAGCFSGRFMKEIKPLIKNKKALESKQIFIAHGTKDNMLPMKYANENKELLESWKMNVHLSTDEIGHSISDKQLNDFVEWMNNL